MPAETISPAARAIQRISLLEGSLYSLMVGLGETYLVAFALSVGIADVSASYLSILPIIIGSVLQFMVSRRAGMSARPKHWLMTCTGGQGLILISLAILGFSDYRPIEPVLMGFMAAVYWALGFVAGPLWNTSMVRALPYQGLHMFFFRRNALTHIFSLISLVIACLVLGRSNTESGHATHLLSSLILCAGIARLLSTASFRWHDFPTGSSTSEEDDGFGSPWLKRPYVRPAIGFMFLVNMAVNVSGPFFAAYMLKELKLDFIEFNILLGSAFVSRTLAGYVLNGWVKKFGVRILLIVGMGGITPLPFLWVLTDNYYLLLLVQFFAGLTWGAYDLGLTLSLIERVPHGARSKLLTWSNLVNALGMSAGVGIASLLIRADGLTRDTYHLLFTLSTTLRFFAFFASLKLADVRPRASLLFRVLGLRSSGAHIMKPILLPDEDVPHTPESGSSTRP